MNLFQVSLYFSQMYVDVTDTTVCQTLSSVLTRHGIADSNVKVCACVQELEEAFKLHRRDMLALEFAVLVALEFALHVPDSEIYPHYQRLIFSS